MLAARHFARAEYEKCKARDTLDRAEQQKAIARKNQHDTCFYAAEEAVAASAPAAPVAAFEDVLFDVSKVGIFQGSGRGDH